MTVFSSSQNFKQNTVLRLPQSKVPVDSRCLFRSSIKDFDLKALNKATFQNHYLKFPQIIDSEEILQNNHTAQELRDEIIEAELNTQVHPDAIEIIQEIFQRINAYANQKNSNWETKYNLSIESCLNTNKLAEALDSEKKSNLYS